MFTLTSRVCRAAVMVNSTTRYTALIVVALLFAAPSTDGACGQSSQTTVSGRSAPRGQICPGQLIFEENFNSLNWNTWKHEANLGGGGNGEFQWYTDSPRNSFIRDGKLVIEPTLTTDVIPNLANCHIQITASCNGACERWCSADNIAPPVQSARLTSIEGFAFKYGRVEIRAKLPTGDWLWPAMWLMPKNSVYGQWPRSGEIDLMEARGNRNYVANGRQIGVEQFASTLHFGTENGNSAWWSSHFERNTPSGQGLNRDFHLYQMEWAPTHISVSLDNQWIGTIPTGDGFYKRGQFQGNNPWARGGKNAPFDQEFYFILNLAVGGTNGFFPEQGNAGGKPWRNDAPHAARDFWNGRQQWLGSWNFDAGAQFSSSLQVDYIKVFAL